MSVDINSKKSRREDSISSKKSDKNTLSLWVKRIAVVSFFTFGIYLTCRHILVVAVLQDKGGEVEWTAHLVITLVWVLMVIVGFRLRNKALKKK